MIRQSRTRTMFVAACLLLIALAGIGVASAQGPDDVTRTYWQHVFGSEVDEATAYWSPRVRPLLLDRFTGGFLEALEGTEMDPAAIAEVVGFMDFPVTHVSDEMAITVPSLAGQPFADDTRLLLLFEDDEWRILLPHMYLTEDGFDELQAWEWADLTGLELPESDASSVPYEPHSQNRDDGLLSITLHGIQDEFELPSMLGMVSGMLPGLPEEPYRYIALDVSVSNSAGYMVDITTHNMWLEDDWGFKYEAQPIPIDRHFDGGEIRGGSTRRGYVTFAIPEDVPLSELTFVYNLSALGSDFEDPSIRGGAPAVFDLGD